MTIKATNVVTAALLIGSTLLADVASASTSCTATVHEVMVDHAGFVYPWFQGELSSREANLCNIVTPVGGIAPEVCKQWTSLLMAAQLSGRPVRLYVPQNNSGCPTFTAWNPIYEHPNRITFVALN
jgi:hypothetical protein